MGALGISVGGLGVTPAVLAQDLVFVPLLALGCFKVGELAFGRLAGLFAVVFALGSPMIIEGSHQLMLDAPEAALVAVAVWAILASERFSRMGVCALAGAAVGLGLLTKETFVFFVAGVVLVVAARGGLRAWRGLAVLAAVAFAVAAPWYLQELSTIHRLGNEAFGSSGALTSSKTYFEGIAPPRLSEANLTWYFWSFLNWQLFLPLLAFAAVGGVWTVVGLVRGRSISPFAAELVLGAFVSWLALTETFVHDPRYAIPMTVYFAVLGAGWLSRLRCPARAALATALVLVALANSLGVGFGLGATVKVGPGFLASYEQKNTVTLYETAGLWLSGPTRDGMLELMRGAAP